MARTVGILGTWLLFAIVFFIFSASQFALIFFIASALLFAWQFLSVHVVKDKVSCEIIQPKHLTKNEQATWQMIFTNHSRVPVAAMKMEVVFEHVFTKQQERKNIQIALPAKKAATINVEMKHQYSGQIIARIAAVEIQDALGTFRVDQTIEMEQSALIMPNSLIKNMKRSAHPLFYSAGSTSAIHSNGDDLAELKVYKPGDPVKRIHWKLSSKVDELFVKQLEITTDDLVTMTVDFTSFNNDIDVYDQLVESVGAQLFSFIYAGRNVHFAFYSNGWYYETIQNEFEAIACIKKLLLKEQSDLTISDEQWRQLYANYPGTMLVTTDTGRAVQENVIVIANENHQVKEGTVA